MSCYAIYILPETFQALKRLPGNMRQRIKRAIHDLSDNPRPTHSKRLYFPDSEMELWRLKLDNWRIVYAIDELEQIVDVLAVRKRPPYDYSDLAMLLAQLR